MDTVNDMIQSTGSPAHGIERQTTNTQPQVK